VVLDGGEAHAHGDEDEAEELEEGLARVLALLERRAERGELQGEGRGQHTHALRR